MPTYDVRFYRDILLHNRDNVLRWLDSYVEELRSLRELVVGGDAEALFKAFDKAVDARVLWLDQRKKGYPDLVTGKSELPTMGGFLESFLGLGAFRRPKRGEKREAKTKK